MASSSSMPPPWMKDEEPRNWSELPPELTSSIMLRLGAVEILENAQKVCRAWRRVSKDPSVWRKIDMRIVKTRGIIGYNYLGNLCRNAVDRSEGGLVEINIGNCGTDSLLTYIADRSSNLRSLGLEMHNPILMTNDGLVNAVAKLPLLEVLEVSRTWSQLDLKAIGHSCPKLKKLKLNCQGDRRSWYERDADDDDALAIAESMPQLRHLHLFENTLTDTGLNTILDNCPRLEHLDLRQCLNINLSGDLEKRCLERIKEFRRPNDSTADCPFHVIDSVEEEFDDDDYSIDSDEYVYHIFGDLYNH